MTPTPGRPVRRSAVTATERTKRTPMMLGRTRVSTSLISVPDAAETWAIQACVNQW